MFKDIKSQLRRSDLSLCCRGLRGAPSASLLHFCKAYLLAASFLTSVLNGQISHAWFGANCTVIFFHSTFHPALVNMWTVTGMWCGKLRHEIRHFE